MRPTRPLWTALLIAGCITQACTTSPPRSTTPYTSKALPGLSINVKEHAHDGTFSLKPEEVEKTDANSTLEVRFDTPKLETHAESRASARWQRTVRILQEQIQELATSRAALNEMHLDHGDVEQERQLQQKARIHDEKVQALFTELESRGLNSNQIATILSGRFDGEGKPTEPYANLARWLRKEIETLERDTVTFIQNKDKLRVTVQALHEPVIGNAKYLHIEDYDSLPEGEYKPIDRYGLKLTEPERQRMSIEGEQAALARDGIRELISKGETIKPATKKWVTEIKNNLKDLGKLLSAESNGLTLPTDNIIRKLETAANSSTTSPEEKNKAKKAVAQLKVLQQDIASIDSLRKTTENLALFVQNPGAFSIEQIFDSGGLIDRVNNLVSNLRSIPDVLKSLKGHFPQTSETIVGLSRILAREELHSLTQQPTKEFLDTLSKDLPETSGRIMFYVDLLRKNFDVTKGVDTLAETDQKTIPHTFDNLTPARIEMARAGLTLGDRITIKVKMANAAPEGQGSSSSIETVNYKNEAVLTGFHRQIGVDLIFARGFGSDDARKWRPNIAARGEWHYLIRDPQADWQKLWNWLDLGLGVHAASLNQGPQNIQVGLGGNLSLWSNFVSVGYGHNLITNRQYVFIGLNLLSVLNKAQNAMGGR